MVGSYLNLTHKLGWPKSTLQTVKMKTTSNVGWLQIIKSGISQQWLMRSYPNSKHIKNEMEWNISVILKLFHGGNS